MRIRDPKARDGVDGRPDGRVDVGGDLVEVGPDGWFEHPDIGREWATAYARREGVDLGVVLPEDAREGASADADGNPTCAGKDGDCSRTVDEPGGYCWQHSPE